MFLSPKTHIADSVSLSFLRHVSSDPDMLSGPTCFSRITLNLSFPRPYIPSTLAPCQFLGYAGSFLLPRLLLVVPSACNAPRALHFACLGSFPPSDLKYCRPIYCAHGEILSPGAQISCYHCLTHSICFTELITMCNLYLLTCLLSISPCLPHCLLLPPPTSWSSIRPEFCLLWSPKYPQSQVQLLVHDKGSMPTCRISGWMDECNGIFVSSCPSTQIQDSFLSYKL